MGLACVSGHKSSASFERIFVHSLWMSVLSSTNKTTSKTALYTLCSMDSNANMVCLAHCLYDKENQEGYDRLLGLCQQVKMDDQDTPFEQYLNNKLTAFIADRHPGAHSLFVF